MYAIVDIETTGGSPLNDKITEIAIYIHDGNRIVDKFVSLINPERTIPYYITALTGITNEMVANAPTFYQIAKEIVEITEGKTIVAHSASFDYNFIRQEFKNLGYTYKRDVLCTIKLSRKLIPGMRSYSLGNICNELNIQIIDRHRAAGDALATIKLFEMLLFLDQACEKKEPVIQNPKLTNLNPNLDPGIIDKLPEEPGVYYLYEKNQDILYIGKSKNISQRVLTHMANNGSKRAIEMKDRITDINYELTGSELIAFLMESYEIKKHKPVYNRAQRRTVNRYGLYTSIDDDGYIRFFIERNVKESLPLTCFSSQEKAKIFLTRLLEDYKLCQKLSGLYKVKGPCFHYQVGICYGACAGLESPEEYNERAAKVLRFFEFEHQNFLIIDHGRTNEERSVVKIENGKYIGFGYVDVSEPSFGSELLHDCIKSYPDNRDVHQIIKRYLKNNRVEKIIRF